MASAHEFAFYTQEVESVRTYPGRTDFTLDDKDLVKRLTAIVRVKVGDTLILFNEKYHLRCNVLYAAKNEVTLLLLETIKNKAILPSIHWLLPLLERSAFESAISNLTVLGATTITPIVTQKTHRTNLAENERARLERIMVAASEQSKQFVFPYLEPVIHFSDCDTIISQHKNGFAILFDIEGQSSRELARALEANQPETIICMVGPEGDLTDAEKNSLKNAHFNTYALTPSILRAELATTIGTGIIRSLL